MTILGVYTGQELRRIVGGAMSPPAVASLSVLGTSPSRITASWLMPSWGGTISHYEVSLNGQVFADDVLTVGLVIDGLTPDTEYLVEVRAVSTDGISGPPASRTAWTRPDIPYDEELGTPGDRPALTVRPGATNTGPRQATTQTMSGSQALAAVLSAPVEADGKRYLRRVHITGGLNLSASNHTNIAFQDCVVEGSSIYTVRGFTSSGATPPSGALPEFQYCEIRGGSSATFYGGHVRFLRCNMHRGTDIIKATRSDLEIYGSWLHDTMHPDGAHCDIVQIVSQAADTLFHWNNMQGFNAPESPSGGGGYSSGVLQTGTVTGNIGPVVWRNNWFGGAGYTIRNASTSYTVDYLFRDNRFDGGPPLGTSRYGPLYQLGNADFDDSNIWDDTGLPVL